MASKVLWRKSIGLAISFVLTGVCATSAVAQIQWTGVTTIAGTGEVLNIGPSLYAYDLSNAPATVNGITFQGGNSQTNLGTDVSLGAFDGGIYSGYLVGTGAPASNLPASYQLVLTGGVYNFGSPATVTLNNLTLGRQYAVQVWVDDSRDIGSGRTETVTGGGNTVTLTYPANSNGALGQYTTGYFIANGSSQTITMNSAQSTQINAMQVQSINLPAITWSAAQNISAGTDVSPVGNTAYAYNFNSNSSASVNGVTFTGLNGALASTETPPNFTTTGFNNNYGGFDGSFSEPPGYNGLLSAGIYGDTVSGTGAAGITLGNLAAGHQYLVQYWVNDSRNGTGGSTRAVTLSSLGGNSVALSYNVGGASTYGQYGTGTFTATGPNAVIQVVGIDTDIQMNAVQLRDFTNIGYWSGTSGTAWDANTTANFCTNVYTSAATFGTFAQATSATQNAYFGDCYYNSGSTVGVGTNTVKIAAGGVSTGIVNFINSAANYTVTSADAAGITGATSVVFQGPGTVTMAASNSYSGTTTITGGLINLQSASSPLGTGTLTLSGGTLDSTLAAATLSNSAQNWGGSFTFKGSNSLNLGAVPITLAQGTQVTVAHNTLTVSGGISGGNGLTLAGSGTVVLGSSSSVTTATSSFTGDLTISDGTTVVASLANSNGDTALGLGSNSRNVNVNAGATLLFVAPNATATGFYATSVPTLNINGGTVTNAEPGGPFPAGKINNALNNVNLNNGVLTATTGEHEPVGPGYAAWNVNGTITSTGNSLISTTDPVYGTLMFGNAGLSSGTTTINVQSGTLTVSAPLVQDDADNQVSWMYVAGNGALLLTASNTYSGGTWIGGGTLQLGTGLAGQDGTLLPASGITNNSTLVYNLHGNQTISYPISGNGSLVKLGPSQLTLTGPNTYVGLTTASAGTLQIGDGTAANGGLNGNVVNDAALVFANPFAQTFGGSISGSGSLTKNGAGTLTLIGQHSYAGPTSIVSGVLQLGPANPDLSAGGWTVNSNGAFANAGPAISGGSIALTDGNGNEGRSAFYGAVIPTNAPFTASFTYQAAQFNGNALADGIVAMLQSDSRGLTALGQPGSQLGFGGPTGSGISPGIGLALNIYSGAPGGPGQALAVSGSIVTPYGSTSPVDATNGDPIQVTLSYDGSSTLNETLMDLSNSNTFSTSFPVGNLAAALGSSAYFGLSGSDGGAVSIQTIGGVTIAAPSLNGNILPKATALSIASGGTLDLNGINQQVAALSGSGSMTNSGGTLAAFTIGGPGSSTFAGTIGNGAGPVALAVTGGKLTLSGTNTYNGGTTVDGGTLIVTNSKALADGSSLTVGNALLFPASIVPAPVVSSGAAAVATVPEPGTLSLAAVAVAGAVLCRRCRRAGKQRGVNVKSATPA